MNLSSFSLQAGEERQTVMGDGARLKEETLQSQKESNALADAYREMLLEQIAYLDTVLRVYGKIDEEKEPITTAAAKALEQTYARLS